MNATRRLFALLLLLTSVCQAYASPKVSLREAIQLAEAYVAESKIENRHRYLRSVTWNGNTESASKSCWTLFWAPDDSELVITDGQLVVWVCNDGKEIRHQDTWA